MIPAANFIAAVADVLAIVLRVYFYIVIASAIVSWVNADPYNRIVRALRAMTDPVYARIRRMMPFLSAGGIDFTPIVVILILQFLERFVVGTLYGYAATLS